MKRKDWLWMPHAGHFVLGHKCRFHLATYVGNFVVSTVGELVTDDRLKPEKFELLGSWGTYETMVFKAKPSELACCPYVMADDGNELDGRRYDSPGDAVAGHMEFCEKYAKMCEKP